MNRETMNKIARRIVSDVEREGCYGNPFRYLLKQWGDRGQLLAEAAGESYGIKLYKMQIVSFAEAWDIWIGSRPDDPEIKLIDNLVLLYGAVDDMLTAGMPAVKIKDAFFKHYSVARYVERLTERQSYLSAFLTLQYDADELKTTHDQHLVGMSDDDVREYEQSLQEDGIAEWIRVCKEEANVVEEPDD